MGWVNRLKLVYSPLLPTLMSVAFLKAPHGRRTTPEEGNKPLKSYFPSAFFLVSKELQLTELNKNS